MPGRGGTPVYFIRERCAILCLVAVSQSGGVQHRLNTTEKAGRCHCNVPLGNRSVSHARVKS